MIPVMSDDRLKLSLGIDAVLPNQCCWRIDAGYLRMVSLSECGESFALGDWGPSDIVIPTSLQITNQVLFALSEISVVQCDPTAEEQQQFILDHLQQLSALLVLSRVRPMEDRLLRVLVWLGERFGRVNSIGISLSLNEMNLTHRNLAELIGSTRVTVTKSLMRLRQEGLLINTGHNDILIPHRASR